ncbi:Dynein intermediate chain 1, axonemal [Nymphon striatum]|nr:Dynein intermediate chain 1, axonemal [Nymphon striatum]
MLQQVCGQTACEYPAVSECSNREDSNRHGEHEDLESGQLRNAFEFCDRETQTPFSLQRDKINQTEPIEKYQFSSDANLCNIRNAYENSQSSKTKLEPLFNASKAKCYINLSSFQVSHHFIPNTCFMKRLDIIDVLLLEGLKEEEIIDRKEGGTLTPSDGNHTDFKYYEDKSDELRGKQGTLLPLWRFHVPIPKQLSVTSICFSPKYPDIFVATYGTYKFVGCSTGSDEGAIVVHSLKNFKSASRKILTDSGVLCAHLHRNNHMLLVVGFYDGNVAVFDLKTPNKEPFLDSQSLDSKHQDPVWQVIWLPSDKANGDAENTCFLSVSDDGWVKMWTLSKDGLVEVRTLRNKALISNRNSHRLLVHAVRWNNFHSMVFITCGADWSVRLWHCKYPRSPLLEFEFDCTISDVAWAPYSSTVFALVTNDGRIFVYDLVISKNKAMAEYQVKSKCVTGRRLTTVVFSETIPILVVGHDSGIITSYKLSPNLRKDFYSNSINQYDKMDKIIDTLLRRVKVNNV